MREVSHESTEQDTSSYDPVHSANRQQKLLVVVAATLVADAAGGARVPRGADTALHTRIEGSDPQIFPVGQSPLPAGRRAGRLGLAFDLRVPCGETLHSQPLAGRSP